MFLVLLLQLLCKWFFTDDLIQTLEATFPLSTFLSHRASLSRKALMASVCTVMVVSGPWTVAAG